MKRISFLLIMSAFMRIMYAQEVLIYSQIIPVEGISAAELFDRTEVWFTKTFVNPNKVIQQKDKENGLILCRARMPHKSSKTSGKSLDGYIDFALNVYIKEGRIKFEMTDMLHTGNLNVKPTNSMGLLTVSDDCPIPMPPAGKGWRNEVWKEAKDNAKIEFDKLAILIKLALENPLETQKDDW